ncbi:MULTISPECIES: hypothetical protein [Streptomyces]|uniref:Uncharacterized protein n=1 Tax=Streptomyces chartreusis NRRL 3882 TaxID=1079985 RepID=A0A2N9BB32_STRCX|nr:MULTISPECIES: hypothetical protein [Streptomyces]SOR80572.1 hypothetical protein SCNRRL3882_4027 [Streptomyces chartreusis NRRL 3882]
MAAPVDKKVSAATAAAYVGSTGLLASLEAVQDHAELVGWMPPALAPFRPRPGPGRHHVRVRLGRQAQPARGDRVTVPEASVAVELERLRGTVSTGFAEVKGFLSVLVERSTRNEQDLKQLREDTDKAIVALTTTQVEALKTRRWPLQTASVLVGVGALVVAIIALFLR